MRSEETKTEACRGRGLRPGLRRPRRDVGDDPPGSVPAVYVYVPLFPRALHARVRTARAALPARPRSAISAHCSTDSLLPALLLVHSPTTLCPPPTHPPTQVLPFRPPRNFTLAWNCRIWEGAKRGDLKPSVLGEKERKSWIYCTINVIVM